MLLEDAKIFEFADPGNAVKSEIDFINNHFFLPFRTVCVDDGHHAVMILHDIEEGALGLGTPRLFINFLSFGMMNENVSEDKKHHLYEEGRERFGVDYRDTYLLWFGSIATEIVKKDSKNFFHWDAKVNEFVVCTKDKILKQDVFTKELIQNNQEYYNQTLKQGAYFCEFMYDHFIHLNDRDLWIVENAPVRKPGKKEFVKDTSTALVRADDRPIYSGMPITEIRTKYGLGQTTGRKQTGPGSSPYIGPRRRHWRILRSDYWGENQGKEVEVSECWVGPREVVIGNRRYRVLIDK